LFSCTYMYSDFFKLSMLISLYILESRKWQNMVENNVFCLISMNCIYCINAMIFSRQILPLMFTLWVHVDTVIHWIGTYVNASNDIFYSKF
jgi:hypothetical protein